MCGVYFFVLVKQTERVYVRCGQGDRMWNVALYVAAVDALRTGWSDDPGVLAVMEAVYAEHGAQECVFNACTGAGKVKLFFESSDLTTRTPEAYDWMQYGEFFQTCRPFVQSIKDEALFTSVVTACIRARYKSVLLDKNTDEEPELECDNGLYLFGVHHLGLEALVKLHGNLRAYNACILSETPSGQPEVRCLAEACGLDRGLLGAASRASAALKQTLQRITVSDNEVEDDDMFY
jgi:hypothetical protein